VRTLVTIARAAVGVFSGSAERSINESTTPAPAVAPIAVATKTTRAVRAKLGAGAKYPHSGLKFPAERIRTPQASAVAAVEIVHFASGPLPSHWCNFAQNNLAKTLVPRPILVCLTGRAAIGKPGREGRRQNRHKNWELLPIGTILARYGLALGSLITNPS
jgi:hypothetical protein